jgi:hypothetical protein
MIRDVLRLVSKPAQDEQQRGNMSMQYFIVSSTPLSLWRRIVPMLHRSGLSEHVQTDQMAGRGIGGLDDNHSRARLPDITSPDRILDAIAPPAFIDIGESAGHEQLMFWIRRFPNTHLLLLHTRPERALERAMNVGKDPAEFLDGWSNCARILLQLHRSHRNRVTLVDVDCVLAAPESFASLCQDHLGLPDSKPWTEAPLESATTSEIYRLIAAQLVIQSPGLTNILDELEASSMPVGNPARQDPVDCGSVYKNFISMESEIRRLRTDHETLNAQSTHLGADILDRDRQIEHLNGIIVEKNRQVTDLEKRISDVVKEGEEVLLRLHQTQEDLETYYLKSESDIAKRSTLEKQLHCLQDSNASVKRELERVKGRATKLARQLETTRTELQSRRNGMLSLERDHKGKNRLLRYMTNSRSWRYTALFRAFYKRFIHKPGRIASQ